MPRGLCMGLVTAPLPVHGRVRCDFAINRSRCVSAYLQSFSVSRETDICSSGFTVRHMRWCSASSRGLSTHRWPVRWRKPRDQKKSVSDAHWMLNYLFWVHWAEHEVDENLIKMRCKYILSFTFEWRMQNTEYR